MKCYYTYSDGVKYLIPMCMSVVHSDDIEDCCCPEPSTEHYFAKKRFNEVVEEKNKKIKILLSEVKRLKKEIEKLINK